MRGKTKPYSERNKDAHDDLAVYATIDWLSSQGCSDVRKNSDIFAADVLFRMEGERWRAEVEVKREWKGGRFPFRTVHIPERKGKLYTDESILFLVWASNLEDFVVAHGSCLRDEYLLHVPNKMVAEGEFFYDIPVSLCEHFHAPRKRKLEPGERG